MRLEQFSAEKKRIIENILALFASQGVNYILPIITFPYLLRVLGPERFGLVAFAQAFIQYFMTITNYGFVHTVPRRIAVYREDKEKLFQIFNSIMLIKFVLLAITFIFLIFLVFTMSKFRADWEIYLIAFLTVFGNVIYPVWFFQGMEHMKYIGFLNTLSRIIFTIAIFVFVKTESDYLYVPLFNAFGLIVVGIMSLWVIVKDFNVKIFFPSKQSVVKELKEGWHIFVGLSAVSLYSNTNTFVLGMFTNNTTVGYFTAGETLIRAIDGMLNTITQAIYPYASRLANISRMAASAFIRKMLIIVGGTTFLLGIAIFLCAHRIVDIAFGPQYTNTIAVIQILAPLPFFLGINGILGVPGLLAFNMNRAFSVIVILAGLINLILALILVPAYKHIGISISLLITELSATIIIAVYLSCKRIVFFPKPAIKTADNLWK
jgi:PST family polysaccharide transporter